MNEHQMTVKVLIINSAWKLTDPGNLAVAACVYGSFPTLHDYDVIIFDTEQFGNGDLYSKAKNWYRAFIPTYNKPKFVDSFKEQLETGGIIFCFAGADDTYSLNAPSYPSSLFISPYDWCPIPNLVINEPGKSIRMRNAQLGVYSPLFQDWDTITYQCHFRLPKDATVLVENRAGYPISAVVPIGNGKLVLLPRLNDIGSKVQIILNDIIPRMVSDEIPTKKPIWLTSLTFTVEPQLRKSLADIEKIKRLAYAEGKDLENVVKFAFEYIGFSTIPLKPEESADITASDPILGEVIVEVKSHKKDLGNRSDVAQLIAYLTEVHSDAKGILVCNSEAELDPPTRGKVSFTDGALTLAQRSDICLVSTLSLMKFLQKSIEEGMKKEDFENLRKKLVTTFGLAEF